MAIDQSPAPPQAIGSGSQTQGNPLRPIGKRTGLPTGRAVIGALLVTLAILGLFLAYRQSQEGPTTTYLVVARQGGIPAGERIAEGDLVAQVMELSPDLIVRTYTGEQLADVLGSVAKTELVAGQLVQQSNIFALAPGEDPDSAPSWEVALTIDTQRALAGTLRSGEVVDVISTVNVEAEGDSFPCTFVAATGMRVISVDNSGGEFGGTGSNVILLSTTNEANLVWTSFAEDSTKMHLVRTGKSNGVSIESTNTCGVDPKDLRVSVSSPPRDADAGDPNG